MSSDCLTFVPLLLVPYRSNDNIPFGLLEIKEIETGMEPDIPTITMGIRLSWASQYTA